MVGGYPEGLQWLLVALADDANQPILRRLPPTQRAKLLMALLALVVLGLALVALIALGARWYRRTNSSPKTIDAGKRHDDWASKPLRVHGDDDRGSDDGASDEPPNGDGNG
jgi:hypothetical protein